jgi:hypothetical protein
MLRGICRCGWNCDEDRAATEEELGAILAELDIACERLREALVSSPEEARIIRDAEEVRRRCRRDREFRDSVIQGFILQGVTREDAEQWVDED